jgi:hypothetical protein
VSNTGLRVKTIATTVVNSEINIFGQLCRILVKYRNTKHKDHETFVCVGVCMCVCVISHFG